jgi:CubicO group peptidase (beta-lactamase class C family)
MVAAPASHCRQRSSGVIVRHLFRLSIPVVAVALLAAACTPTPTLDTRAPSTQMVERGATAPRRLDTADLAAIRARLRALVDERQVAGMVTLIQQRGRVVEFDAYGLADVERATPMRRDAIMAIASMTKPVTGVAMMLLYEQGLWSLDDPVTKFIPEFAGLQVMREDGTLEPMRRPPTMRELMSHTAGFSYGFFGKTTVDRLYFDAKLIDPQSSLAELIAKLAKLPLKHQPGTRWEYSIAVDIQGYLVEKLSGMPYDVFVRERVLLPLGMKDTGFSVTEAARSRLAFEHAAGPGGGLVPKLPQGGRDAVGATAPRLPSPGGALYSTAADYARFAQMLLNGGRLGKVRLLKPETVALMHTSALPDGVFAGGPASRTQFGLDFAIAPQPVPGGEPWPAGTYYWSGIWGTYFWIDPVHELVVVGMLQRAWAPGEGLQETLIARNAARAVIYDELRD